jgi:hypothetical protein
MPNVETLLGRVGVEASAAVELLTIAAECLDAGKPLPAPLAKFLARSIKDAMAERSADRGSALIVALGLAAPAKEGRPLLGNIPKKPLTVSLAVYGDEINEGQLAGKLAKEFDVSPSTARRRIKKTKAKLAEARAIFGVE